MYTLEGVSTVANFIIAYEESQYQNTVDAGGLCTRRPWGFKVHHFQINTKSVKANMMNISIESLSLIEDMVSEVISLGNPFYFPLQSVKMKPYC